MPGLARSLFFLGDTGEATATLEHLREVHPDYSFPQGLLYARSLELEGYMAGALK
jgi:hypothetical protein